MKQLKKKIHYFPTIIVFVWSTNSNRRKSTPEIDVAPRLILSHLPAEFGSFTTTILFYVFGDHPRSTYHRSERVCYPRHAVSSRNDIIFAMTRTQTRFTRVRDPINCAFTLRTTARDRYAITPVYGWGDGGGWRLNYRSRILVG